MRQRGIMALALAALALPALGRPVAQAQAPGKQAIRIVATSYRFEPSLIQVRLGETVVLQLVNADTEGRNHGINAQLFTMMPVAARGDIAAQGTFGDRRFFAFAPGKQIEVEFTATQRGTFTFICGISDHAARGQVGAINVLPAQP